MTISLTLNAKTLSEGQTISASSFVSSVSDSAHHTITQYSVYDSGADGGYFVLKGVKQPVGAWFNLTAAQFAQLQYVAGSSAGSETISIKAYDGSQWSSAYSTTEKTTAPSGPANAVSLLEELGFTATAAAGLITASNSPTYSGSLTYNSMLSILNGAAANGMTVTKLSALQTLAGMLNKAGGLSTSAYVQQLADDVILGNSANSVWNGGSSSTTTLGNLSATSTQTQVNELIGKWFLGTDLPSFSVSAIGESNLNPTYKTSTLPLYGSSGAPNYLDVNQGYLGDCYFVAALGETALQNPNLIKNMITADGNGVYTVEFYVNGQADYVTVNSQLPVMGGYDWANGATQEFANSTTASWVALVEKAFVQLNEQTAAANYGGHTTGNAYEDVNGGTAITLSEITDQTVTTYNLTPGESTLSLSSLLSADFNAHDEIILSTPNVDNGNLVGDHMYMVTGVTSAGTISIQNPWNTAYSGPLQMAFNDSLATLAADNVSIYVSTPGTKVA